MFNSRSVFPHPQPLLPSRDALLDHPRLADLRRGDKSGLVSRTVLRGAVRLSDFVLMAAAGFVVALLYIDAFDITEPAYYLAMIGATSGTTVAIATLLGHYSTRRFSSLLKQLPGILLAWAGAFALLVSTVFFLKIGIEVSRGWMALWFTTGAALLLVSRLVLAGLMRRWAKSGQLFRRAVIYGTGPLTVDLINQLEADAGTDIRITGIFDDREDGRAPEAIGGYSRLGTLDRLIALARETRIDLVIVALPVAGEARLAEVVNKLSVLPADIKLPARASLIRFSPHVYSHIGSVATIDLYDKPIADWDRVLKWLFDKTIGITALVTLAPLMALIAGAIKLESPGPILFRQRRYGFNNELIEVLKFRSMYVEATDADASKLVTRDDPRVTRLGRFLRKSSLDELPQLFNVVQGSLSLVGPRPHALSAKAANRLYDDVVSGYFARHKVKPGITGWAQVNGWRGETDTSDKIEKRVEHDLYYIEHWSLFLDLYILLMTPRSLFRSVNAY
jgi:Undecaprenyl-phosphate glucose phosphotransferase